MAPPSHARCEWTVLGGLAGDWPGVGRRVRPGDGGPHATRAYRGRSLPTKLPGVATISRDPDRLVLFTDAVVAIAITLLVLPLVESVSEHHETAFALVLDMKPRLLSFLLSFAVIARLWLVHHQTFEHVKAYNSTLMWVNMAWLFTIVVLPFPTGMVGENEYSDDHFTRSLYVGAILATSLVQLVLILIVHHSKELGSEENPLRSDTVVGAATASGLLFVAFLLTIFVPVVGYFSLLLLFLSRPVMLAWNRIRPGSSSD